ncbi:MAG TPA: bifunctional precorrin-2 dehydrogenase/sirohydrochlorin ferrochelatase [Acidimicrobiales bacterium]|nr:bifunctional precorrin-2 dehydrogenase/sirohydrochlorin ferrochelatase [Acidimicrobiales bacterium]
MPLERPLYPVGLVLAGRAALVVGGGRPAARKVPGLLACGASVTVVAPRIDQEIAELEAAQATAPAPATPPGSRLELQRRPYRAGEVAGYALAIAATGSAEVDGAVFADGEAAGVLVNAADDAAHSSFVLPALWRRGAVSVAVSTDGTSPALAVWLRDRIAALLDPSIEELAQLLAATRRRIRAAGRSSEGLAWPALIDDLAALLAAGSAPAARLAAERFVEEVLGRN